jgi:hypothetical protein
MVSLALTSLTPNTSRLAARARAGLFGGLMMAGLLCAEEEVERRSGALRVRHAAGEGAAAADVECGASAEAQRAPGHDHAVERHA